MFRSGKIALGILLLLLAGGLSAPAAGEKSALQPEDCRKCHGLITGTMAAADGRHATAVACLDCHPQHPPEGRQTILPCGACHDRRPHFGIGDCRHCHVDPHQPLVSLRDPLKPARTSCLSCHPEIGEQMASAPSRHAELFCNRCHRRHRELPGCLQCHSPHLSSQDEADCRLCHDAHRPLRIVPKGQVPSSQCRACHRQAADALAATGTDHGVLGCSYCHSGAHPSTPKCRDCHGLPHAPSFHSRYRDCLACHGDAHNLIR